MNPSTTHEFPRGTVLRGTYEIDSVLGRGGMGAVYLARHLRLRGRQVAIKFLHSNEDLGPDAYPRFRREAEIATRLGHPNIVQVLDFDALEDGTPFMVMEYLRGESLSQRMRQQKRFPLDVTLAITRQIGAALQAAHRAGVVHRDLKPGNVLLVPTEAGGVVSDQVKLLDFGISKLIDSQSVQTQDAVLLGTPKYMAPEQAQGRNRDVDARTDIFSLGVIVYEMLAGKAPFNDTSLPQLIYQIVHERPRPLAQLAPELPAHVVMAIGRAMAKRPEGRYQDVGAFIADLTGGPLLQSLKLAAPQTFRLVQSNASPIGGSAPRVPKPPITIRERAPQAPAASKPSQPLAARSGSDSFGRWLYVSLAVSVAMMLLATAVIVWLRLRLDNIRSADASMQDLSLKRSLHSEHLSWTRKARAQKLAPQKSGGAESFCSKPYPTALSESQVRDTAVGGNASGVHDCEGGDYSHYERNAISGTQLHVVNILEARNDASGQRKVEVRVKRKGPSVLVLSAHEETLWTVVVEPEARVESIVVSGHESQFVSAPDGIPVDISSNKQNGQYLGYAGHGWPSQSTASLADAAERRTGYGLTSFRSCRTAARFEIDEPKDVRPPHIVTNSKEPFLPSGCEFLASESMACMMINGDTFNFVGIDSHRACSGAWTHSKNGSYVGVSSLVWQGSYAFLCMPERGLSRISLRDGSMDIAPIRCQGVAESNGALFVMESMGGGIVRFDDFNAAVRREGVCVYKQSLEASSMAMSGDQAYWAWHVADEVKNVDLAEAETVKHIELEGYSGWITGLDVTDNGRLMVIGAREKPGIYSFDAKTGYALGMVPLSGNSSAVGLACRARSFK